jgi:hypothetical protein
MTRSAGQGVVDGLAVFGAAVGVAPIDLTLSLAQTAGPAVRLVYTRSVNTPR